MLKANNQALFQGTNNELVSIRQLEIQYYVSVYQSFATQAALIGGFSYGVLQNGSGGAEWVPDLDSWYALFATLTILSAIHIILCSLFLQVYGPGLALYGPAGSMARACDVLRKQQPKIVKSFVLMIFFFVCSTAALFFSVLDYFAAIICSVALCIALYLWYDFSHTIYAQLTWNERDSVFGDIIGGSDNPLIKLENSMKIQDSDSSVHDIELGSMPRDVLLEGFLTRKFVSLNNSQVSISTNSNNKWKRLYFVFTTQGTLLVYKDRKEFQDQIKSSMNERPLVLKDHFYMTSNFKPLPNNKLEKKASRISDLLIEKPFTFLLIPHISIEEDEHHLSMLFSSDTEEEMNHWKDALNKFSDK